MNHTKEAFIIEERWIGTIWTHQLETWIIFSYSDEIKNLGFSILININIFINVYIY